MVVVEELALVASAPSWSDTAWREYCELALTRTAHMKRLRALIVFSPEQGPTTAQRRLMIDEYGERLRLKECLRTALLTRSRLVVGVTVAMNWMFSSRERKVQGFRPDRYRDALVWTAEVARFDASLAIDALAAVIEHAGYPPLG